MSKEKPHGQHAPEWEDESSVHNPFNWPDRVKWRVTLVACYVTFITGFNATSITAASQVINTRFGISDASFPNSYWPVTSWSVGAALAPMIALPLMETYGMRPGYLSSYALFTIFVVPQAVAQNFATLIVTRFLSGCFAGIVQDAMDGIIADVWPTAVSRSLPVTCYVFCLLSGVSIGPVIGGGIVSSLDWRWIFYVQIIVFGASLPVVFTMFKETRGPVIAQKLRKSVPTDPQEKPDTADSASAPVSPNGNCKDAPHKPSVSEFFKEAIALPTYLLFTEPVVFFFTLLSALSYGLVFIPTQSIPLVYGALYNFSEAQSGLVQVSIVIGEVLGFLACLYQNIIFSHSGSLTQTDQGSQIFVPETRLYTAVPGSFIGLAGGLFFYGWTTSSASISWIVPGVALAFTGFGSVVVMQAIMVYITDSYSKYAASASAAVCFGEQIFAAFLPLCAQALYGERAGIGFACASSVLGFIALLLSVAPFVLIWKGEAVRKRSRFMEHARYEDR